MGALLSHSTTGPPEAPPLVLLHGFLGRGDDWIEVAEHLTGDFRCVTLDLPGHGRSLGLPSSAYRWEGAIDAVAATLDYLGITRSRIVGYSMGGRLALGLALRHRPRIARLVLVGTSPGFRSAGDRQRRAELDQERALALAADLPSFVHVWYRMQLFRSLDLRPELRLELSGSGQAGARLSRLRNDSAELALALAGLSSGRMPAYWDRLDDLGVPTLAVAGGRDPKFVELAFRMSAAGLPVMPRVIPEAGHLIPLERPEHLAQVVREFCSDALCWQQARGAIVQAA